MQKIERFCLGRYLLLGRIFLAPEAFTGCKYEIDASERRFSLVSSQVPKHVFVAFAISTSLAACAKEQLQDNHPLVGTWSSTFPDNSCHSIFIFQADGTASTDIDSERSSAEFDMTKRPTNSGYYELNMVVNNSSAWRTCYGNSNDKNSGRFYILLSPSKSRFLMCDTPEIKHCVGPFNRNP